LQTLNRAYLEIGVIVGAEFARRKCDARIFCPLDKQYGMADCQESSKKALEIADITCWISNKLWIFLDTGRVLELEFILDDQIVGRLQTLPRKAPKAARWLSRAAFNF
jgi:hypothetical protein